ncbi:MAG: ADP-ribosylation factor-like protein [Candidatus Heimdallarchaeaceae archaeon]
MNYLEVEDRTDKVLFLGLSQSGKTSIIQVAFEGMMPENTKNNQATGRLRQKRVGFADKVVSVFEVGGQISYLEDTFSQFKESVYSNVKYMFFIVDSSQPDRFEEAQFYYVQACETILEFNEKAMIYVFAHKFDLVPENDKDNLEKEVRDFFEITIRFNSQLHTTSIFDESLFGIFDSIES